MRTKGPRPWSALAFLGVLTLGSAALGEGARGMRQGTRPGFFEASVGPVVGLLNTDRLWAQSSLEIGGHLQGSSAGPALSGSFDFLGRHDWFGMEMGLKFRWDIQVRRGLALYLAPTARAGYAFYTHKLDRPRHYFNLQFGFELRMIFRNRLIVFVRIFSFDFNIFDHVEVAFDTGVGIGVSF